MTGNIAAIVLSYVLGSIPLGYVLGRVLRGIDIREYGSGKTGMTNVLRNIGPKAMAAVFIFDVGKGVAAVFLAKGLGDARWVEVAAASAAVGGHNWSMFLRFTGGRGVNTALGGFFVMSPIWAAGAIGAGVAVIAVTRYVSLGSLLGATFGLVSVLVLAATDHGPWEHFWYGVVIVGLLYVVHAGNIVRLVRGVERRLGRGGGRRAQASAPERGEAK